MEVAASALCQEQRAFCLPALLNSCRIHYSPVSLLPPIIPLDNGLGLQRKVPFRRCRWQDMLLELGRKLLCWGAVT